MGDNCAEGERDAARAALAAGAVRGCEMGDLVVGR